MKKNFRLSVPVIVMLILSTFSGKLMAQPDPPPLPDQHGYNGNQPPQGAPIDGGSEVLLFLGIVYAARKVSEMKRKTIVER
jgi:hypothetical protein